MADSTVGQEAVMIIEVTGPMRVVGVHGVVEASDLSGRQGRVVLASLAVTDQPVPREVLADRVWGERLPKAWERDLSAVISKLRAVLSQAGLGGPEVIAGASSTYRLALPEAADVDVRVARRAVVDAAAAVHEGRADTAVELASTAIRIAERPFMPTEDAPWADAIRAELTQLRLRALEVLADAHAAVGQTAEAILDLEAVLAEDSFREATLRRLMRLHLAAGNRAEAVRAYERTRAHLADELGVDPSPETEQLYLDALRTTTLASGSTTTDEQVPEVRYARSGHVNIAYQVLGDGPIDVVFVPGWVSNIEVAWQESTFAAFLRELSRSCRLIMFDKRGTGLSDPISLDEPPPLEVRMDDVTAVMDAVGSERAVLFGFSEGGAMSLLFAASHPERTRGLILWGTWARQLRDEEYPYGWTREEGRRRFVQPLLERGRTPSSWFAPSRAHDAEFQAWFARYARQSASPGMAIALLRANARMDVRHVLPSVRVPTLVLHRTRDVLVDVEQGRYIADRVPGARIREFAGDDHWPWFGEDTAAILSEMTDFLVRMAESPEPVQQILATLVSVRDLPGDAPVAQVVATHRGALVEDPDAVMARFDGPGRAVACAQDLVAALPEARAGVHTGEVELEGARVRGRAVEVARAVGQTAPPGQVLVTRTVTDLVAGSSLTFEPLGARELGAVGEWPLAAVTSGTGRPVDDASQT